MDTKILLENGTNELEVLEFKLGENSYGINVAKIKEIIPYQPVTAVPNAHPSIEGLFMPRDSVITAIDLKNCLQLGSSEPGGLFFITNLRFCLFLEIIIFIFICFYLFFFPAYGNIIVNRQSSILEPPNPPHLPSVLSSLSRP